MIAALAGILVSRTGLGQGLAKLIVWAGLILAAGVVVVGGYELIKHRGAEEVRNQIKEQNDEAGLAGSGARLSRRDCVAAGGVYHFDTGVCAGVEAGDR